MALRRLERTFCTGFCDTCKKPRRSSSAQASAATGAALLKAAWKSLRHDPAILGKLGWFWKDGKRVAWLAVCYVMVELRSC